MSIQQKIQDFCGSLSEDICYVLCCLYLRRPDGCKLDNVPKVISKLYSIFEAGRPWDNEAYVRSPCAITNAKSVTKFDCDKSVKEVAELAGSKPFVCFFYNERTKFQHAVVAQLRKNLMANKKNNSAISKRDVKIIFDPLGDSVTVREGVLISGRVFEW